MAYPFTIFAIFSRPLRDLNLGGSGETGHPLENKKLETRDWKGLSARRTSHGFRGEGS